MYLPLGGLWRRHEACLSPSPGLLYTCIRHGVLALKLSLWLTKGCNVEILCVRTFRLKSECRVHRALRGAVKPVIRRAVTSFTRGDSTMAASSSTSAEAQWRAEFTWAEWMEHGRNLHISMASSTQSTTVARLDDAARGGARSYNLGRKHRSRRPSLASSQSELHRRQQSQLEQLRCRPQRRLERLWYRPPLAMLASAQ